MADKMNKIKFNSPVQIPDLVVEKIIAQDVTVKGTTTTEHSIDSIIEGAVTVVNGGAVQSEVTLMGQLILTGFIHCGFSGNFKDTLDSVNENFGFTIATDEFYPPLAPALNCVEITWEDNSVSGLGDAGKKLFGKLSNGTHITIYDSKNGGWQQFENHNNATYQAINGTIYKTSAVIREWLTANLREDGYFDENEAKEAYGILYDPSVEAIRLGRGYYDEYNSTFTFNEGEGEPIAVRELHTEDDGSFVMWDAEKYRLVKAPLQKGISENTIQQEGCVAGLKGFYWSAIDITNKTVTLSAKNVDFGTDQDFDISDFWAVGDVISIYSKNKWDKCSTITKIEGNTITINKFPEGFVVLEETEHFTDQAVFVAAKPDIGLVDFGDYSFAVGENSKATNYNAVAFGRENEAYGQYAFTAGRQNKAGYACFVLGRENEATGEQSFVIGYKNKSNGANSFVSGRENTATGARAFVSGYKSTASGDYSVAAGENAKAIGLASIAMGKDAYASGKYAVALGCGTTALGYATTAIGNNTKALAPGAFTCGKLTYSSGQNSFVSGVGNKDDGNTQAIFGSYNARNDNALMMIGNGTGEDNRSNAFEVLEDGTATLGSKKVATTEYVDEKTSSPFTTETINDEIDVYTDEKCLKLFANDRVNIDVEGEYSTIYLKANTVDTTDESILNAYNLSAVKISSREVYYDDGNEYGDLGITIDSAEDVKVYGKNFLFNDNKVATINDIAVDETALDEMLAEVLI